MGEGRCRACAVQFFLPRLKRQASKAAARLFAHAIKQFPLMKLLAYVRHRLVQAVCGVGRGIGGL